MPFTNNRIYYIIGIAVLIFFIAMVAYGVSQNSNNNTQAATPPPVSNTITVTINNNIGIQQIEVTNLNTGKSFTFNLINQFKSFSCTRGDYLKLTVHTDDGYKWNAWWFSPMDLFNNDNPAIICADGNIVQDNQIVLTPNCLLIPQATNSTGASG